jgi:molybdopterin converting factor subunit 1
MDKVKVLFFARLRDALGSEYLEVEDSRFPTTVAALRRQVQTQASGDFAEAMQDPNVFCAVNQRVVDEDQPVDAADEVAFFPPMTGG